RVADRSGEVGYAAEHHALVADRLRQHDGLAVDGELQPADGQHVEAGGGHDDVGGEILTRAQANAGLGEGVDLVGDDVDRVLLDRLEQIAVRDDAHALVPRVVRRLEVLVDVEAFGQVLLQAFADEVLHQVRLSAADL